MRRIFTTVVLVFSLSVSKAQWVPIPDPNFVAYLQNQYAPAMNGNLMDTTYMGIMTSGTIDCTNMSISDLTGIQYFDALTFLKCDNNLLTTLPPLPNSLDHLDCIENLLTSMPFLPNSLHILDCSHNYITSFTNLPNSLHLLWCDHNLLTSLPPFPNSLGQVFCNNNLITSLPYFGTSLNNIECFNNSLTSLPALPNTLTQLYCSNNSLTDLPPLPPSLYKFIISNNPGILCLPPVLEFTGPNYYFNISNTGITCLPNLIPHSGYLPSIDTMPICDLFNNPNNCDLGWNIKGDVAFDIDNNCITTNDSIEVPMIKMNLYDAGSNLIQQVIANWGGHYSFDTQLGDYSTSVDTTNFPFHVLCPVNNSIASNFTAIDSMDYNVDFRLICKPGFNNGVWNIYRTQRFSPNWITPVHIIAGDVTQSIYNVSCSSGISGEVKVIINGPAHYLSPLVAALIPTVNGDTLVYTIPDFSLVNATTDFGFNIVTDTSAQIGDQICFDVTVTPIAGDNNSSNNYLSHCFTVHGSFDPNEKEVSPIGYLGFPFNDWPTYTIHFQNTGTAPAQHIRVLDTLDADLDASTFELLSYSYAPMVQLFGSKVHFNFLNINLPDSSTDAEASKGYVSYRVKPLANLPLGTLIENTASIYFDYNTPVVTNTVSNSICNPIAPTSISETICEGEVFNFNGTTISTAGNYYTTFNSINGCDSVVNLNLSVLNPIAPTSISKTICSGDIYNFNGTNLSIAGNYSTVLNASNGCDSLINLSLTVLNSPLTDLSATICAGDIYNFNGTNLSIAGNYSDTLDAINGCDSLINLNLSILNPITPTNISETICAGDIYNFNGVNLSASGIYSDTLSAFNTCDSIINLNLTVETINTTVTQASDTLTVSGNSIQWFDCNTQQIINGAAQNVFVPTTSGMYAAIITQGNCSDTTSCTQVFTSVNQLTENSNQFTVYPNPTDENITIQLLQPCNKCQIEISNTLGQVVYEEQANSQLSIINCQLLPSGIYFITVRSDKMSAVKKLVKQ